MPMFGNTAVIQDASGNVISGLTIKVYGTQSDAAGATNLLGTAVTNTHGQWPITITGRDMVWARDPSGNVWAVASDTVAGDHATRLSALESATGTYLTSSTLDAAEAGNVNTSGSQTDAALKAKYVVKGVRDLYVPDFGAKFDFNGTSGTDDTAAWQSALNQAATTGAALVAPAASSKITSGLTVTNGQALTIRTPRSGLAGSFSNRGGTWLFWGGAGAGSMITLTGCQNISWAGLGLHGNNLAQGILIRSGVSNSPVSTVHTYRDFHIYRATTGIYVNDAADASQADQSLFESVRMDEIVTNAVTTNSLNATTLRFVRCSTAIASSNTDTIHYNILRGSQVSIVNCNGGFGQDFVRLGFYGQFTTIDGCQVEGSTHVSPAFLRVGATTDTSVSDTTIVRGCVPDAPIILAGPARMILSEGNYWHTGATVTVSGANARYLSFAEAMSATPTVTGTNAMFRRIDADLASGGATPNAVIGTSGSTAASITGNSYAGSIAFTTAAGLAADAYALVFGFASQLPSGYAVNLTPTNAAAAAAGAFVAGKLSSQWELHLHTPPAAATAMTFDYRIG